MHPISRAGCADLFGLVLLLDFTAWLPEAVTQQLNQSQSNTCDNPWQYKDSNGNCADKPNAEHRTHGHVPEGDETCWEVAKCLCRTGQYPGSQSCAPCSLTGTEAICLK